ncbi:MAG TPA: STAS domain-containing protein [Candidatus Omnitrophota bacterium]|nr:STAS domain-containing protein [Candidatus Omnitrophota bacterium]HRZ15413.1 STAS domain-containing protein [Candidatus Omnitrophota bacterium]
MALKVNILRNDEDQIVVCVLTGSLDTETYQDFKSKAMICLEKSPRALSLDLKALEYISSMGIGAVLELHKAATARGTTFMMSNVPPHIEQVFKIVHALPNVQMFESVAEADRYFGEIQKRIKEK